MPRPRDPARFHTCEICGKQFYRTDTRSPHRFCSKQCESTGKKGAGTPHLYKGGSDYIDAWGYHIVSDDDGNEIREHRLVMQRHLGRKLRSDEHVHHGPKGKLCNDIDNLFLVTPVEHQRIHHLLNGRWSNQYDCCIECGTNSVRHYAHGRCKRCYERQYHHKRNATSL